MKTRGLFLFAVLLFGCATADVADRSMKLTKELWSGICVEGNEKQVADLIKRGADVRYAENSLPLVCHALLCKANLAKIQMLVNAGADVNAMNHAQESVLMYAVDSDQPDIVKYLVEKGANVHHRNIYGANALSWAQNRNNKKMLEWYLRNAGLTSMGYGFVKAKSGLWLREGPQRKSASVVLVPHNERVDFLMMMPDSREVIDGINNFWYRVRYKGKEGYVFGGYLGRDPE